MIPIKLITTWTNVKSAIEITPLAASVPQP
jgi:hypothetical protein